MSPGELFRSRKSILIASLTALLLVAFLLRLLPARRGLPYLHEWDEPQIASTALRMMKTGDLNPHFFHYGSLTIYAVLLVDVVHYVQLLGREEPPFPVIHGIFGHEEMELDVIRTWFDHGFLWQVSHPSFYFWNRVLMAVLGTLSVLVTYLLGRELEGERTGFVAAAFLAVLAFHVERSTVINPDLPMSLLALAAIYGAVLFLRRPRRRTLLLALVCCGLAISAKYNGGLVILAPAAALFAVRRGGGEAVAARWLWGCVVLVPAAAFLLTSPYAWLDFSAFLRQAGFEIHHYSGRGHAAVDPQPGWEHFWLQCRRVAEHLGTVPAVAALGGFVVLLRGAAGRVVLFFPAAYFLYMASTRVGFHRNLLVIYPVLAVAAATGVVALLAWLWRVEPKAAYAKLRRRSAILVGATGGIYLGALLVLAADDGWSQWQGRETRTRAVEEIASLSEEMSDGPVRVGIAAELRVHPTDLARLAVPYEVRPHLELVCEASSYDLVVTGASYVGLWSTNPEAKRLARVLNGAVLDVERREIAESPGHEAVTRIDALSQNPTLWIYLTRRQVASLPEACVTNG